MPTGPCQAVACPSSEAVRVVEQRLRCEIEDIGYRRTGFGGQSGIHLSRTVPSTKQLTCFMGARQYQPWIRYHPPIGKQGVEHALIGAGIEFRQ